MENYKPNSNKYRNASEKTEPEKNLKPVVSGSAKVQKKSDGRKLLDLFVSEDAPNVKSYVFMEVLIPAIKKAIDDIVSDGIHMILYGSKSDNRARPTASRVSYNRFYDQPQRGRAEYQQSMGLNYENIEFDNRGDAESVLVAMEDVIERYGRATVAELYELADIPTNNYALNKYGWTDLHNARVERYRDVYILRLPKALPMD